MFEIIGQHPLATGILAVTGMVGFFLSVVGFSYDRTESKSASVILERIDRSIIELTPNSDNETLQKAEKVKPYLHDENLSEGVNPYIWRASLEALNFMPLDTADAYNGILITDWYTSPQATNERFKANVIISDKRLRADGLKVTIFKQTRKANGWADTNVDPDTPQQIENSILSRARELYIATVADQ